MAEHTCIEGGTGPVEPCFACGEVDVEVDTAECVDCHHGVHYEFPDEPTDPPLCHQCEKLRLEKRVKELEARLAPPRMQSIDDGLVEDAEELEEALSVTSWWKVKRIIEALKVASCKVTELERVLSVATEDLPRVVGTDKEKGEIEVWSDGHAHAFSPTSTVRRLEEELRTERARGFYR